MDVCNIVMIFIYYFIVFLVFRVYKKFVFVLLWFC